MSSSEHAAGDSSKRLRRLEDRAEIGELVSRYMIHVDDRDLEALAECFTPDGRFHSKDGRMDASGRDNLVAHYRSRREVLGVTYHYTHDQVIRFDDADSDRAEGIVTAHAETVARGQPHITALRYNDVYRRLDGRWRIENRLVSFLYYLPVQEYVEGMRSRLRVRVTGQALPADYPETVETWAAWKEGR